RWSCGATLSVAVDAMDRGAYLNGQALVLELFDPTASTRPAPIVIPQVAPGRYAVSVEAPRTTIIADVQDARGGIVSRFAVAARYAAEFNAIGNDRRNLTELADRTGGAVVEPGVTTPLRLPHG